MGVRGARKRFAREARAYAVCYSHRVLAKLALAKRLQKELAAHVLRGSAHALFARDLVAPPSLTLTRLDSYCSVSARRDW